MPFSSCTKMSQPAFQSGSGSTRWGGQASVVLCFSSLLMLKLFCCVCVCVSGCCRNSIRVCRSQVCLIATNPNPLTQTPTSTPQKVPSSSQTSDLDQKRCYLFAASDRSPDQRRPAIPQLRSSPCRTEFNRCWGPIQGLLLEQRRKSI